ncbi:hypothetical protein HanXRQr2_Chr01g0000601 [Helianthus annuus]|uniref:Reverse transcriptase zinc-binding domain-containing protein n=1 Tax=Helianthus annuus TaxID=4232 RepID=A0A9K3P1C0_HELAN|nr:hypothetical protein HanXRQr2_Chr01g0000601 [Helianthus annuus]KAJ0955221.1 hypothetical protein HanPSC8_Chr01g0000401 [Helianthus annuus]
MCYVPEETVNHILWDCLFAKSVWWSIFNWIKLPFPDKPTTVQEILANAVETNGSKTWKKLIGVVIQVTAWEIWKARNEKTFNERQIHFNRTADSIKEIVFLFVTGRSKFCNLDWERWIDFNIRDVIL